MTGVRETTRQRTLSAWYAQNHRSLRGCVCFPGCKLHWSDAGFCICVSVPFSSPSLTVTLLQGKGEGDSVLVKLIASTWLVILTAPGKRGEVSPLETADSCGKVPRQPAGPLRVYLAKPLIEGATYWVVLLGTTGNHSLSPCSSLAIWDHRSFPHL